MVDTRFTRKLMYDKNRMSIRKFKAGRRWVRLRSNFETRTIHIIDAKTQEILQTKKFKGSNSTAFFRAAKFLLSRYTGVIFPKVRRFNIKLKGNVNPDWIKE